MVTSMPRCDDLADGVVNRQAVGDVAAGAVDVERDRAGVVVGQLAQAFDDAARRVFFDVADEIDIPQPVRLLLAQGCLQRIDELEDQSIVQVAVDGR